MSAYSKEIAVLLRRAAVRSCFVYVLLAVAMGGCVSSRFLKDGEKVLQRQRIRAKSELARSELQRQLSQQASRRSLITPWWMPYVELYQFGLRSYDTSKYQQKIAATKAKFAKKMRRHPRRFSFLQARRNKRVSRLEYKIKEGNAWMRAGKPLVRYSKAAATTSAQQLLTYTQQQGYFNATVNLQSKLSQKKRVLFTGCSPVSATSSTL